MRTALVDIDRVVAINRRLRLLVRLVFVASTLIVAALFSYWIVERSRALRAEIERELVQHARFSAEHVRLAFSNVEKQTRILIRAVEQRPPGPEFDEAAIHRLAKALADESPEIRSLWVVDADGRVVAESAMSPPNAVDASDRPYFYRHQATTELSTRAFIGTPLKSRVTDR